MNIRATIEKKIKSAGLTKKEAAERAGIIPTNLNGMIAAPSWPTLERIASALGLTVAELVSDSPAAPSSTPGALVCPVCGAPLALTPAAHAEHPDE